MTLEEIIRKGIGDEGPHLYAEEHEARIDNEMEAMTAPEVLRRISDVLEELGIIS